MNEPKINGQKNDENDAMSVAPAGGRTDRRVSKGFVFAVDAILSLLLLAAFAASIAYFSSQLSASNVPLVDQQKKAGDMLVLLDKLRILGSRNATAIEQAINQTMMPSLSWNLAVEYYNYTFFQWADNSSGVCKNITIRNTGASALTNFPAYINLTYDSDMQTDYADLRFYGAPCNNGGTLMDYEIENYTSANAHIWVRVPTLSTGNTVISVYYKNNTAVNSGENPSGVWDSTFTGVWHLKENPAGTAPQMKDSKGANNGTSIGMAAGNQVAGQIDGSLNFSGTNNAVNFTDITAIDGATALTVSAWIRVTNLSRDGMILSKGNFANNQALLIWRDENTSTGNRQDTFSIQVGTGSAQAVYNGSAGLLNDSNWHYVTMTYVGGSATGLRGYVDGKEDTGQSPASTTGVTALASTTTPVYIGRANSSGTNFTGQIDEVQISNTARSADWINESYLIVANQNDYVIVGLEESSGANATTVTFTIDNNVTLGANDTNADAVSATGRIFVVRNDSTGMIDQYGRARLKTWAR